MKYSIGAFAIILDTENRVLLSHRNDKDAWNMPGGKAEEGESPWETVQREVLEETCLKVEVKQLVCVNTKKEKQEMVFTFLCKVVSGELELTDEADQHEYFAATELPENTLENHRQRIDAFFENSGTTVFFEQIKKELEGSMK